MKANIISKSEVSQNYTKDYVKEIYDLPFLELLFNAQSVHRLHQPINKVQLCTLSNIKSGNCPEDCKYCPQSSRYKTEIEKYTLLSNDEILKQAINAKENGATRFCMGAAWRSAPDNSEFDEILNLVRKVAKLNVEVCCTLGMLSQEQAYKLKEAGLTAYNHNLDTSENFYKEIISTRTYKDRLETIQYVSNAGIQVCCGGIIGLGESQDDRIELIKTLANLNPQPESVPINVLMKVKGTPLEAEVDIDPFELVRTIATSRILLPKAKVRLSAGRLNMSHELQALCFMAGANSIFIGEKLLTTKNPDLSDDEVLFKKLKLEAL
ncbi:MAG: biotin synthase BioB [Candidatus Melainabacteria bacterium]|nr:biotin synthase BioB [Candidatus Melainabacteria bacterium]